jgi:hypothetical protein
MLKRILNIFILTLLPSLIFSCKITKNTTTELRTEILTFSSNHTIEIDILGDHHNVEPQLHKINGEEVFTFSTSNFKIHMFKDKLKINQQNYIVPSSVNLIKIKDLIVSYDGRIQKPQ